MTLDSKARESVMKALSHIIRRKADFNYIPEGSIDDACDAISEIENIQFITEEITSDIKVLTVSRRSGKKFKPLMKIRIL